MARKERTRDRFGTSSTAYVESPVHARGEDLEVLRHHLPPSVGLLVDVSTGAGHTALHLAPHADRVLALDLAPRMTHLARRRLREAGFAHGDAVVADVDHLPLRPGSAHVVTNRIAAHHYPDLPRAVAEMARVLRPGGVLLAVDNVPPRDADVAAFLHALETKRDPTHVTTRSEDAWLAAFRDAGLDGEVVHRFRTRLTTRAWAKRGGRTGPEVEEVVTMLQRAPEPVREALEVEDEPPSFTIPKTVWRARHPP